MPGESVLIVDDHPVNLKLIRFLLESEGYHVQCATDADEVLRALETLTPRLILMDIQLPGIDGLALTRRLKSSTRTKDVQIIAITAYAMKGDEERALSAGCDGYIAKPIDTYALPGLIARYLAMNPHPMSYQI
jgi:two-component system, cell cycle response regulator DivK